MKSRTVALVLLLSALAYVAYAAEKSAEPESFETASARFEQNATDGDVEAVFEAGGGDDGLVKLTIVAPDGRKIVDFSAPGSGAMGIRQFRFESPEPTDKPALKKAYPEGEYTFTGETAKGDRFRDKTTLSHKLPETTAFVSPKADASGVQSKNLKISWAPVKGVKGYTIELEPSRSSALLELKLPASVTSFIVPDGMIARGEECTLGIGTVSADGNISVIETSFTTAK
jgi:hypothetical protein